METIGTSRRRPASSLFMLTFALVALATIASAAPVAAGTPPPDYGSTVRCKYHTNGNTNQSFTAQFRRIAVTPPQVFAKSGRQTVGWQFNVIRLIDWGGNTTWTTTYTSRVQKAVATTTRAAAFNAMRVSVTVPDGDWSDFDVHYRVALKMFWYRANGSLQRQVSHEITSSYGYYVNGTWWDNSWNYCPGVVKQWVDGPF